MDLDIIFSTLDLHLDQAVKYNECDKDHRKTDKVIERKVSDLFELEEWHRCIKMLERIRETGLARKELCFDGFWKSFLVDANVDLEGLKKYVKDGVGCFESYLKFILVILGQGGEVKKIQEGGMALRRVIDLGTKAGFFAKEGELSNIIETVACYRNWWIHYPVNTSEEGTDELRYNQLSIPFSNILMKDMPLLDGIVRLELVALLLIIRRNYEALDHSLPQFINPVPAPELQFDEGLFLDTYFQSLKRMVDSYLQSNAIQELKTDNQFGYYEPKLRFSHSKNAQREEMEGSDSAAEQWLPLNAFRKESNYKMNIILGMPGAGKTTTLYLLLKDCIRQYEKMAEEERDDAEVPILISLNSATQHEQAIRHAIHSAIGHRISDKSEQYQENAFAYIHKLMKAGRVVLFFDGLNEMASGFGGSIVNSLINTISEEMPASSRVYITGRKYEYECGAYAKELEKSEDVGVWLLKELSYDQIEGYLSPEVRSRINRGQIEELFSSPLILSLFLESFRISLTNGQKKPWAVPSNRGEMLETFMAATFDYNKINPYFANLLLKRIAVSCSGRSSEKAQFEGCIENMPTDLIDRLAAVKILSLTPARPDSPELVSFAIDTFQEFYRAKYVIDILCRDSSLSLYALHEDECHLDPQSSEDYETLKLIFEIGSSPLCHQKRGVKKYQEARQTAIDFSFRLAKDYLNSPDQLAGQANIISLEKQPASPARMNPRLPALCAFVRNVPFSRDIKESEEREGADGATVRSFHYNAKDIAELLVLNNLRWFRAMHPTPFIPSKRNPDFSYLDRLMTAASVVGGKKIWGEVLSTYWLLTFGIVSSVDYPIDGEDNTQNTRGNINKNMFSSQLLLHNMAKNCRDYIYFYDEIHQLHIYCIKSGRIDSASSISAFLYQYFLCYLPAYAKKHLYYHLTESYKKSAWDHRYATDINTLLCYIGDSQLLVHQFRYNAQGLLRVKELRYVLSNYREIAIQKFVLSEKFFSRLVEDGLKSLVIRYILFRLGLTPVLREFLFQEGGIKLIPEEDVEPILDMIPLHSIPKDYVDKHYDKDICEMLVKENGDEVSGDELEYVYYGEQGENVLISISDVEEDSFIGSECHVGNQAYSIVNDTYVDAVRLYCQVKSTKGNGNEVLLPDRGQIVSEGFPPIPYRTSSPNTILSFYLYGDEALSLFFLVKEGKTFKIDKEECTVEFPEQRMNAKLAYFRFRVLELAPRDSVSDILPYSGELRLSRAINKVFRPNSFLHRPERFESLAATTGVKTEVLHYRVFGQNKSFLWAITEKIVTSADLLVGHRVTDVVSTAVSQVRSIKPFNSPYLEFWFRVAQKVSIPPYGTFSYQNVEGDYTTVSYSYCIFSEDRMNFKLRVFDESVTGVPVADLYRGVFLIGNTPLQLVSVEKICPERRHSIWTLEKKVDCTSASGSFFVLEGDSQTRKKSITVSAETRSTIKRLDCAFGAYDNEEGKLYFFAKQPKGSIGPGQGNINLLKGLYMNSPFLSSARYQIGKDSELRQLWIKHFHIRFDIRPERLKGYFYLGDCRISILQQEEGRFWLWCPYDADIPDMDNLEERLRNEGILKLCFGDGSENEYRILEIREEPGMSDYSMVIQSPCPVSLLDKDIDLLREKGRIDFQLQVQVPVLNDPVFPRTFRALYPKTAVRFLQDVKRPNAGFIIVPRPVSLIHADTVFLEGMGKWKIRDLSVIDDRYLSIGLCDKEGRIPKVPSFGMMEFLIDDSPVTLWYRHMYELVDYRHPERYHAELCRNLLEEIMSGEAALDSSVVDFFIKKSRASDLVTQEDLLTAIETQLPSSFIFNVCRVLYPHPLRGLQAYSILEKRNVLSSDTMPEGHGGRPFAWQDFVLMERNHRLTLINGFPRYHCLGYKTGYVVAVRDARTAGQVLSTRKKVDIYCPELRETYHYYYDTRKSALVFNAGDDVDFFASVNYRGGKELTAENAVLLGTRQPIVTGVLVEESFENNQSFYAFDVEGKRVEIRIYRQPGNQEVIYHYHIGQSYSIINGPRLFIIND